MAPMAEIALHDARTAARHDREVLGVWNETFGDVDDPDAWHESIWERHRARSGYRLATAHEDGQLVGFSWGYTGERGQFWSDLVLDRLGEKVADWVGGHFEFVELAVLPSHRGQGIGARLHDTLLAGLPHQRALLGTADDPSSPAVRLYTSRGWRRLGRQSATDQVMGKLLSGGVTSTTTM